MMTIYSTRKTKLIVEPIELKCPHCGTPHTTDMYVFQKYKSFLGLPFFPTNKTGVAYCTHCSQSMRQRDMSEALLKILNKIKARTHIPLWTWTGTALVILGIVMIRVLVR